MDLMIELDVWDQIDYVDVWARNDYVVPGEWSRSYSEVRRDSTYFGVRPWGARWSRWQMRAAR